MTRIKNVCTFVLAFCLYYWQQTLQIKCLEFCLKKKMYVLTSIPACFTAVPLTLLLQSTPSVFNFFLSVRVEVIVSSEDQRTENVAVNVHLQMYLFCYES